MEAHNFLDDFTEAIGKDNVDHVGRLEETVKFEHESIINGDITMGDAIRHIKKSVKHLPKDVIAGYIYSRVLQGTTIVHSNVVDAEPYTIVGLMNNRHWEFEGFSDFWTFKASLEPLTSVRSLRAGDPRLYVVKNVLPETENIEDHVKNIVLTCIDRMIGAVAELKGKECSPMPSSQGPPCPDPNASESSDQSSEQEADPESECSQGDDCTPESSP
jgi:hypothetical protein